MTKTALPPPLSNDGDSEVGEDVSSDSTDTRAADETPQASDLDFKNAQTIPLANVIERDESGAEQMYTTLYDADNKVIDTNDPALSIDQKYRPVSEGGQGVTLDVGSGVRVYFRAAALTAHDIDGKGTGIQAGVVYAMNLPAELVPVAESKGGEKYVDPDEPLDFFDSGTVSARGGIYTVRDADGNAVSDTSGNPTYQLRVSFDNVEGQLDVSGDFQYTTTVSNSVTPGSHVSLTFVPGGTVGFDVTPEPVVPVEGQYSLSITGSQWYDNNQFRWQATLTDGGDASADGGLTAHYGSLGIRSGDGIGFYVSTDEFSDLLDKNTSDMGLGDAISVEYDDEDATEETLAPSRSGSTEAVYANADGTVRVRLIFSRGDVSDDRLSSNDGSTFITPWAHLVIDDGNGGEARHVRRLTVNLPATAYDDWSSTSSTYLAKASAFSTDGGYADLDATGSFTCSYGDFSDGSVGLGNDGSHDVDSYYTAARMSGNLNTNTSDYCGNYYWLDYDPCYESTLKDAYYPSIGSFLAGGTLSLGYGHGYDRDSTAGSTFTNFELCGRYSDGGWVGLGEYSIGSLVHGSESTEQLGAPSDIKLRKQLSEVFSSYSDRNQTVMVYRSRNQIKGRYAYVVIDPDTKKTARMDKDNGWCEYMTGDADYPTSTPMWDASENEGSARAASWRIHVFNAPNTDVQAFFGMSQGAISREDSNGSAGTLTVRLTTGNGRIGSKPSGKSTCSSYVETAYRSTMMSGQWVDDNTIMWKLTAYVGDWKDLWRTTTLFAQAPQALATGGKAERRDVTVNVPGAGPSLNGARTSVDQTLSTTGIYALSSDGTWAQVSDCSSSDLVGDGDYGSTYSAAMGKTSSDFGLGTSIEHSWGKDTWMLGAHRLDSATSGSLEGYVDQSSNTITLAFFSTIAEGKTVDQSDLTCTAELVAGTPDLSSYARSGSSPWSGATQYPVKLKATGQMGTAVVSKSCAGSVETTDDQGRAVTETTWALQPSISSQPGSGIDDTPMLTGGFYYGGYQGNLTLTDSMSGSGVSGTLGTGQDNPARYTHIMSMFDNGVSIGENSNGCGCEPIPGAKYSPDSSAYWLKYDEGSGIWLKMGSNEDGGLWDPYHAGTYRTNLNGVATVTVRYSGNMCDNVEGGSAPLEITITTGKPGSGRGFAAFTGFGSLAYTTSFCPEEYMDAMGGSPAAGYDVTFRNSASTTSQRVAGQDPSTSSFDKTFAASLSIKKSTDGVQPSYQTGAVDASYSITTTVGITGTPELSLDDFISAYSDSGNMTNGSDSVSYAADDVDALKALAAHMDVGNLTIRARQTRGTQETSETVYANGKFADGWGASEIRMGEGGKPGSLFSLTLRRDDGAQIEAQTSFDVTYDLALAMDGDDGFRASDFYHGGRLDISNSAIVERDYQTAGDDASEVSLLSADHDAEGVVLTQEMGDQTVQVYDSEAVAGGEVDRDHLKLRVWPTADVRGTYLMEPDLAKAPIKSLDENGDSSWLFYEWTGSEGKASPSVSVTDGVEFKLNDLYATRDDLTDQQKQDLRARLAYIAAKHVSVSNLKVYLTDDKPQVNGDGTNLSDADLQWSVDGQVTDGQGEKDGHTYTVSCDEGGVNVDPSTGEVSVVTPSFTVTGSDLGFNKFLATTYDMHFDQEGFLREAREAGLLDDAGFATGTTQTPTWTMTNTVKDQRGAERSESSSEISVDSATLGKSVTSADEKEGSAEWSLDAYTGSAADPSELRISDELSFTGDSEGVCAAARAATSISDVCIALEGDTIWQGGSVTEAGRVAGWSDDNFSVTVDGAKLDVVVENAETAPALAAGQHFRVTYKSTLDKDAYVAALVEEGLSSAEATYKVENAAQLRMGSALLGAHADQDFTPDVPVKASKETLGNPDGGQDTQTVSFRATGEVGEATRKNFTMTDTVTPRSQATALTASLEISALKATLTLASGSSSSYSADEILAGDAPGMTLSSTDGGSFALETPGTYGWKLSVASLPAGAKVTVDYDVHVDREAYVSAGGELGPNLALSNVLSVGTADGSSAGSSSTGNVSVKPDVSKKGVVASGTSDDGNPLVDWTFDVNLTSIFDAAQLAQLKTANIRDRLNFMLRPDMGSVRVYDLSVTVDGVTQGSELPASAYDVSLDEATNTLVVAIKNPAVHPNVRVCATTEVRGSLDGISNSVDLEVDGEKVGGDKTEIDKPLIAVTEYGTVTSVPAPTWVPTASKLVDGAVAPGLAGRFRFECVEVDAGGQPVEGGYRSEATNGADGSVAFDPVSYSGRGAEGTRWYQVRELAGEADGAEYAMDGTVYTVRVDVARASDGRGYLVSSQVQAPEGAGSVTFSNSTTRDFTVTKSWDDGDGSWGLRPSSVTVRLLRNGEAVEGSEAVLSDANGWSHTWEGLPIAGCSYSVEEDPQVGYEADVELAADGWSAALTNRASTGALEVSKRVEGDEPEPGRTYWLTVSLTGEGGAALPLTGRYGDMDFEGGVARVGLAAGQTARAEGLPAGAGYSVREDDVTADGFEQPSYEGAEGTVPAGGSAAATVTNVATPTWVPTASKLVDGAVAPGLAGRFRFECVEVDAGGQPVEGGYRSEATNGADGSVAFDPVSYSGRGAEGTRWYQVRELAGEADGAEYAMDGTVYTVRVDVARASDGRGYLVSSQVQAPEGAGSVTFSNSTTRDFTVTKSWDDGDGSWGLRPSSVTVRLLRNGEAVEGSEAVLSDANGWSHTWEGLPIAGCSYSVEEDPQVGYEADVELAADGWSAALTNRASTGALEVSKRVEGDEPEPGRTYWLTVSLTGEGGAALPLTGRYGDMDFEGGVARVGLAAGQTARAEGLPAGAGYSVREDDVTADGFEQPSYEGAEGTVPAGGSAAATVTNVATPKTPETPETPNQPPAKTQVPDTGDLTCGAVAPLAALGGGLCFAVAGRRRRKGRTH